MISRQQVLALLSAENISFQLFTHPPVFTAEEAKQYCSHIDGVHVKNLFLRDKKKRHYFLITVIDDKRVDLIKLAEQISQGRLSFASHHDVINLLGVQPGSVTPLAILNSQHPSLSLYIDSDINDQDLINIHPMDNTATIQFTLSTLLRFLNKHTSISIQLLSIPCK